MAKPLMQHAERFAIETEAERLTLAIADNNEAAQALYRKLGYVCVDHSGTFIACCLPELNSAGLGTYTNDAEFLC